MKEKVLAWAQRTGPVRMAFLASLLLSAIAAWNAPVLNRDGLFYVEWAQEIVDHGLDGAKRYGLLLSALPVTIALVGAVTRLGLEASAYLTTALFLAGACALVVAITRQRLPAAAWAACLVVLAMPAYNEYRTQVLREYGLWFFGLLTAWFAMRWQSSGRLREALACQVSVLCAAMFRTEAFAYFPALMLWQAMAAPTGKRLKNVVMIGGLPLAVAVIATALLASGILDMPDRLAHLLKAFDPVAKWHAFNDMAARMSEQLFGHKYTREEAGYVLFFGLLTIIPIKFLKMSGVLIVPMAFAFSGQSLRAGLARWQPLPWLFLAHALALAAYLTYQFFLQGRYEAMLHLLAVPVAAGGLAALMARFPRWRHVMLALVLLTLLANVVSFSPRSTQIVEAGRWLSAGRTEGLRVYVENPRVGYYAGLGYLSTGQNRLEKDELARKLGEGRFDMVVLDASAKDPAIEGWLASNGLEVVKRFTNKGGNAIIVAVPAATQHSPANAERSRSNTGSRE